MMLLALALSLVVAQPAIPQTPDHAAIVRRFVDAFNARDIAAMLALATDDVEWASVDGVKVTVETAGKEALRASMTSYFKSCPTCRSTVDIKAVTANRAVAIETASWTAASGPRSQHGLSVYEFKDGHIRRVYYYPVER
ncbi:MAG: nuclear transport factor 2 family protein [Acidobacteria bacterium]|nr:nuclear transport factor 2 family protein [Acidobacteriota bacterium]